jgi:hypothetical protein
MAIVNLSERYLRGRSRSVSRTATIQAFAGGDDEHPQLRIVPVTVSVIMALVTGYGTTGNTAPPSPIPN